MIAAVWTVRHDPDDYWCVIEGEGKVIFAATGPDAEAKARLIAAAPATVVERDRLKEINAGMHDALVSIEEYWNQDRNEQSMFDACWHSIETARVTIAKAGAA